jgi:hypothetical protein
MFNNIYNDTAYQWITILYSVLLGPFDYTNIIPGFVLRVAPNNQSRKHNIE